MSTQQLTHPYKARLTFVLKIAARCMRNVLYAQEYSINEKFITDLSNCGTMTE
ncbi:hypothetical protein J3369_12195 [Alteromonas sp. NFXS44]|uniref:hypothetical protein n=1 Tax=Alteromonas sp. NFXS44 TaxID=2818435 RepID=UPI0032DFD9F1